MFQLTPHLTAFTLVTVRMMESIKLVRGVNITTAAPAGAEKYRTVDGTVNGTITRKVVWIKGIHPAVVVSGTRIGINSCNAVACPVRAGDTISLAVI